MSFSRPGSTPANLPRPDNNIKMPRISGNNTSREVNIGRTVSTKRTTTRRNNLIQKNRVSPKDETPIVVEGKIVERENIIPINLPPLDEATIIHPASPKETPNNTPEQKENFLVTTAVSNVPKGIPDYEKMTQTEQNYHRTVFRTQFGMLRESHPQYYIPDFSDNLSLQEIHQQYDIYVKHMWRQSDVNEEVNKYRIYMVIGWLGLELIFSKLGLSISGYTESQMRSMNHYNQLLTKLGERRVSSTSEDNSWPIEVKLVGLSLINAIAFIIIKLLSSYMEEGRATSIIEGIKDYVLGDPVNREKDSELPPKGGSSNPFGNVDIASMLAGLGSLFGGRGGNGNGNGKGGNQAPKSNIYDD